MNVKELLEELLETGGGDLIPDGIYPAPGLGVKSIDSTHDEQGVPIKFSLTGGPIAAGDYVVVLVTQKENPTLADCLSPTLASGQYWFEVTKDMGSEYVTTFQKGAFFNLERAGLTDGKTYVLWGALGPDLRKRLGFSDRAVVDLSLKSKAPK